MKDRAEGRARERESKRFVCFFPLFFFPAQVHRVTCHVWCLTACHLNGGGHVTRSTFGRENKTKQNQRREREREKAKAQTQHTAVGPRSLSLSLCSLSRLVSPFPRTTSALLLFTIINVTYRSFSIINVTHIILSSRVPLLIEQKGVFYSPRIQKIFPPQPLV